MAAVLEALILIPHRGHPGRLPADVPVVDLEFFGGEDFQAAIAWDQRRA